MDLDQQKSLWTNIKKIRIVNKISLKSREKMPFHDFVLFSTNKCHRSDRGLRLSPKIISDPQAISTTTITTNIKQNKEMRRQHQTTTTCLSAPPAEHRTRKHISQVKWTPTRCTSPADMASSLLFIFFLCLLWPTTTVLADPSAEPTIQQQQQQQQQGGLLPFPEGKICSLFVFLNTSVQILLPFIIIVPARAKTCCRLV